jgi:hypothetical protein
MTSKPNRKRFARASGVLLAVYFISYLVLTLNGSYRGPYPPTGEQEMVDGVWVIRHQYLWHPHGTRFDRFGFNFAGAAYSPLIMLDRLIWHRNKAMWP